MKMKPIFLTAAIVALASSSAFGHRFWIIPSSSVLSGEDPWVTFDAAVSNSLFFADHHAPELEAFSATDPEGKKVTLENGNVGKYRTTFDVNLAKEGTYRVGTVRQTLTAYWKEEGENQRWRGSVERIAEVKDKPGVELTDSTSRVETFVTSGEPTVPTPTAKGLEIVFNETHPNDLFAGESATFTLHFNGKPAAGVEVVVIKGDDRYRNEVGEIKVTTGDKGEFTFTWPEAGRFWLNATTEGESIKLEGIEAKTRSSYTATFEVLPE